MEIKVFKPNPDMRSGAFWRELPKEDWDDKVLTAIATLDVMPQARPLYGVGRWHNEYKWNATSSKDAPTGRRYYLYD